MSTVEEVKKMYKKTLSKYFTSEISQIILPYIHIVATDECAWCCVANSTELIADEYWKPKPLSETEIKPFQALCGALGHQHKRVCIDLYRHKYCGVFTTPEDYARRIYTVCQFPPEIIQSIDWNSVWEKIADKYCFAGIYIFLK